MNFDHTSKLGHPDLLYVVLGRHKFIYVAALRPLHLVGIHINGQLSFVTHCLFVVYIKYQSSCVTGVAKLLDRYCLMS